MSIQMYATSLRRDHTYHQYSGHVTSSQVLRIVVHVQSQLTPEQALDVARVIDLISRGFLLAYFFRSS